jgi:threonine/homoserine/homoserine lactone efflux protein
MSFKTWFLFLVMESALSLSPGPAVFYVVSQGARDVARALPATSGILTANALYFTLSATSLGALIAASARFFTIAKWAGAAYLAYLGFQALRSAGASHAVDLSESRSAGGRDQQRQIYFGALTLQLSNPKALLFFLALLPQFIDAHRSVVPQMAILAATSMLPEFCILSGYGWLAHRAAHASAKFGVTGSMNRWLSWIEGIGLLGCATLVLKFSRSD